MLNIETKKILNSARDVLVGKVPDPKAQVEQITFAMFYKFMDEKDKESIQLGGKAQFFVDEFENFSWSKLMDPRLGGIERMDLYTQALAKMSQNPHIAQLFRDIYKDAFIPFRSPETLNLFLKEIDKLDYSNTESLGDAFEYLLSIMGSQGDAGQFRTPRHIIDFIVDVVDPKKTDTILDPACGTAGFLISSYKHIIKQHDGKDDPEGKEKPLTPDEKKGVVKNLSGYDISPDMVRLSKVNLYLHGFPNPTIYEYDTLSSEEKWDENFDVILANPPFMTPKGGIKPHKRFSIQANRSEVLFVDYILEHLKPNGRAGVIVPEGIIFQSTNAYKELRKKLVEDGLYCVVSLPAGVFQPYAGVKTSILFFDNEISKKVKHILFVKIQNDGFDLGAQRRPSIYNDLPLAIEALKLYKKHLSGNGKLSISGWPEGEGENIDTFPNLLFVSKEKIFRSDNFNLTSDRYRSGKKETRGKWPLVELGTVTKYFNDGDWVESKDQSDNGIRLIQTGNVGLGEYIDKEVKKSRYVSEQAFEKFHYKEIFAGDVLISRLPDPVGRACIIPLLKNRMITSVDCTIVRFNEEQYLPKYFLYISKGENYFEEIFQYLTGSSRRRISRSNLAKVKIPKPPIKIQEQIVAELDGYQKVIDGAKQILNTYKPQINYKDSWKRRKLAEIATVNRKTVNPKDVYGDEKFTYIDISSVENGTGTVSYDNKIRGTEAPSRARRYIENGDVLISTVRPNLQAFALLKDLPKNSLASTGFAVLTPKSNEADGRYLYYAAGTATILDQMTSRMQRGAYPSVNQNDIENLLVPTPPVEVQKNIADEIYEEEEIVKANQKLVEIYEEKIKSKISEIW
ncbi:MAG: N-6 DNA methylase [Patescibacteria group bacterium]